MVKAVAVIDIGMTNKKIAVYDGNFRMLDSASCTFGPISVDGVEAHDLAAIETWMLDRLSEFARSFAIGAVAVTTHGATMVPIGEDGNPCAPCFFYTHDPGPEFQERFYRLAGDPRILQETTGTPPLSAMINPAKILFFIRERFPEAYNKAKYILNYPQYWVYRLTGKACAEGTFVGCHSYLWDWKNDRYSDVAKKLGAADKMPYPLRNSFETAGRITSIIAARTGLDENTIATTGIHDSNASLLPHLAKLEDRDFVLNSTGTWCVLMHPQEEYRFSPEELGKVVFFNRSAYNKPVKTAIFLGGMEYEAWASVVRGRMGAPESTELPEPSPEDYRAVIENRSLFILPELVPGSGQFPGSTARICFSGNEYALADIENGHVSPECLRNTGAIVAALKISLALQTLVAFERTGARDRTELITEGGFRRNAGYNAILASLLGERTRLTDIPEATSLGAAMTATAALEGVSPHLLADRLSVDYIRPEPIPGLHGLEQYKTEWLKRVSHDDHTEERA
jgi:sugar (pentulose or hexulose) kinase